MPEAPPASRWTTQARLYVVVGGIQLLVDWLVFVALSAMGLPVVIANVTGRISGALLGFVLNARFTFSEQNANSGRVALQRFITVWLLLTVLSSLAMQAINALVGLHWAWLGKPLVDALLAVAGFLASRHWIYAARRSA